MENSSEDGKVKVARSDEPDAITVRGLTKSYGSYKAIADVSFSVKRGEIVGFLGPNGAGKSTTMRILAGLLPANSGIARICGISVSLNSFKTKSRLGYMPENNPLPEELRVVEYLRWRAKLKNVPPKQLHDRVESVMESCDLARKARRKLIGSLSKGFRQRVGIADTLLSEPDVVILDEPTIGLDPHQIVGIRSLIHGMRGSKAVLISSHILPEIENVCDRVIIINQGRIVASGTPEELRRDFITMRTFSVVSDASAEKIKEILNIEECTDVPATQFGRASVSFSVPVAVATEGTLEKIRNAGVHVEEFCEKYPTLEDIFMAATRRNYDEVQDFIGKKK